MNIGFKISNRLPLTKKDIIDLALSNSDGEEALYQSAVRYAKRKGLLNEYVLSHECFDSNDGFFTRIWKDFKYGRKHT